MEEVKTLDAAISAIFEKTELSESEAAARRHLGNKLRGLIMAFNTFEYFYDAIKDIIDRIPENWEYTGYHNDVCPSWQVNGWHIWAHHADKSKREAGFENDARFSICPVNEHGEFIQDAPSVECETLIEVFLHVKQTHNYREV